MVRPNRFRRPPYALGTPLRSIVSVAFLVITASLVEAQQGPAPQVPPGPVPAAPQASEAATTADSDLRSRIERLERQNDELERALKRVQAASSQGNTAAPAATAPQPGKDTVTGQPDPLNATVSAWTASDIATVPANPSPGQDVYRMGGNLAASASFKDGLFLWIDSPNKEFTMHIGGWMQLDNVLWDQSTALKTPPGPRAGPAQGVASGAADGGIGDLQDGEYFRRIRLFDEGTFWTNGEYRLIVALENIQFSTVGLDEFWVGVNNLPVIGSVRFGHVKNAIGLEGDMSASSRSMTFMERSSYSEAIELNQNFVTGVRLGSDFCDHRMSYQAVAFRSDQAAATGSFFGDGQWGLQARLTALPLYEEEGRHLLHLGFSGGWRTGSNNIAVSYYRTNRLSARPELRDDDPGASPSGGQTLPNANSNRMVDTAAIAAGGDFLLGTELLYIRGPFSFQAEYGFNWITDAVGVAPSGSTLNPPISPTQDYMFSGGYVQVAYTLTGENRAYDRSIGTLAREYYGKSGPASNALSFRDQNGNFTWTTGAWEIAARYSYVNLNDGHGLNRIQGGAMDGVSVALNWYLNNNMNIMFDWIYDNRYDLPSSTLPGYTSGFGTEVQFQF